MEDYEQELHGVEDDFHSQFAAELEVLAELEGRRGFRRGLVACSSAPSWSVPGVGDGYSGEGRRTKAGGSRDLGRGAHRREKGLPASGQPSGDVGCPEAVAVNLLSQQGRRPYHRPGAGTGGPLRRP